MCLVTGAFFLTEEDKQGFQEGSYQWGGWGLARENDKKRGRPTETQFDINPLLNLGLKAATKGAM